LVCAQFEPGYPELRWPVTQPMGVDPRLVGGVATTAAVAILALAVDEAAIARAATERALAPPRSRRVHAISAHNAGESSGAPGTVEAFDPTAARSREAHPLTGVVRLFGVAATALAAVTSATAGRVATAIGVGIGAGVGLVRIAAGDTTGTTDGRTTSGSRCGSAEIDADAGFFTAGELDIAGVALSLRRTLSGISGVVARPVDADGADGCRAGLRAFEPRSEWRDGAVCSADVPAGDVSMALVSDVSA
jgi:hypothetical protein